MPTTNTLPWDFERAITAFQVKPDWYEQYWLKPASLGSAFDESGFGGSTDLDFHRARAARERALARQQAGRFLLVLTSNAIRRVVCGLRGGGMPKQYTGTKL